MPPAAGVRAATNVSTQAPLCKCRSKNETSGVSSALDTVRAQ